MSGKLLKRMYQRDDNPPLFGIGRALHKLRANCHDCTGGRLTMLDLLPGSPLRIEIAEEKRGPW